MVGVASDRLGDGRTGKAGTASMVGVASDRLGRPLVATSALRQAPAVQEPEQRHSV
jgi:hypothetical protein